MEFSNARIVEPVAFPFFIGSSQPRNLTQVSRITGGFSTSCEASKRIMEWVAYPFSSRSSWPRNQAPILCISCIGRQILNHCATKTSIAVPLKLKNIIYYPATPLWVYTPKKSKQGLKEIFMHTRVYSSIIHNSQEVVATQVSVDQWMDNENVVFTNNGILTSQKIKKFCNMLQLRWNLRTLY